MMKQVASRPIRVAVFGMGKMGTAACERMSALGHDVIAWNRTNDRAMTAVEEIVQKNQKGRMLVAATLNYAMNAIWYSLKDTNERAVALVFVSDTDAASSLLRGLSVPPNVTIANLASGSPDDGRTVSGYVTEKYIDGAYCGPPEAVRTGSGQLFVSASEESVVEEVRDLLEGLGKVRYAGPVGASRALDYAVVDLAFVNLLSFISSSPMLEKEGVDWNVFCEEAAVRLKATPDALKDAADRMLSAQKDVDYVKNPVATLGTWRNFWASRLPYLGANQLPEPHLVKFAIDILDKAGANDPDFSDSDVTRLQEILRRAKPSPPRGEDDLSKE